MESKKRNKQTKQNRNRCIDTENEPVAARGNQGEASFHIGEELRDTNFHLQKNQRDVIHSIGNIVNNIAITMMTDGY